MPPSETMSEVDAAPANPGRWFRDEVQPHDRQLKAYLRGAFPSVRDVDDVVQESYLRIWRRQLERPIASVRGFLYAVARNIALDVLRRDRLCAADPQEDARLLLASDDAANATQLLDAKEKMHLLAEAVLALPPRCREIVVLRKIEDIPQREVALRLGISESTVENQLRIGLDKLEQVLKRRQLEGHFTT